MSKIIYLDQMKWIDLARSFYGRADGQQFDEIRELAQAKVEAGEWVFPISTVHYMETASNLNDPRRERLARFMSELSRQHAIQPYPTIEGDELDNAIRKLYGLPELNLSDIVIAKDLFRTFGLRREDLRIETENPEIERLINEFLDRDDVLLRLLALPQDEEFINVERATNQQLVESLQKDRENLLNIPEEYRYKILIYRYFEERLLPLAVRLLRKLEIPREEWLKFNNPEETFGFLESIPSLHVRAKLNYATIRDLSRPVDPNDNYDLSFLATAIPYCDVVITERSWTHYVRQNRLDRDYDTVVTSSLVDLRDID